jgi:preprotein translocase subunit SecG
MINVLFVANIVVVLMLIAVILFQKSEGGVLGMGGGGKGALFTARGAGNLMTKVTYWLGGMFFVICMILAYLVAQESGQTKSFIEAMASRDRPAAAATAPAATPSEDNRPEAPTQ